MEGDCVEIDMLKDAEEYVSSVMSGNLLATIRTPLPGNRKRRISMPDESEMKRVRNISSGSSDLTILDSARRKLNMESEDDSASSKELDVDTQTNRVKLKARKARKKKGKKPDTEIVVTSAEVHREYTEWDTRELILKMHADISDKFLQINTRMETLENNIEKKISDKLMKNLDKRLNTETSKVRKEMDKKMSDCKSDLQKEIDLLNDQLQDITKHVSMGDDKENRKKNIVIRKLPESDNENINNKVGSLLKDGLKLKDIKIEAAERKISYNKRIPGVVIVKLNSEMEKERVLSAKSQLKDNNQYEDVYIHADKSKQERVLSANFRSLVNAYTKGDKISVRGTRVVTSRGTGHRSNTRSDREQGTRQGTKKSPSRRNPVNSPRRSLADDTRDKRSRRSPVNARVQSRNSRDNNSARNDTDYSSQEDSYTLFSGRNNSDRQNSANISHKKSRNSCDRGSSKKQNDTDYSSREDSYPYFSERSYSSRQDRSHSCFDYRDSRDAAHRQQHQSRSGSRNRQNNNQRNRDFNRFSHNY